MHKALAARALIALLTFIAGGVGIAAATPFAATAAAVPATPDEIELTAHSDSSIEVEWEASPGATSYRIYRGTASGAEGNTPIATVNAPATSYDDIGLSATPTYFYQVSAVNSSGESARTPEDASKTPPPIGTGGNVAGVPAGNGWVYYCKDALLGGFDWFQTLNGWFPDVLGSSGSDSPGDRVVDMAYAEDGSMTFNNVVVPTSGLYTVDWRYAFQGGLFPGVNNRQMGLKVNGTVITRTQSFPITGSFDVYQHSALQVQLRAGVNSISQIAVSDHGLSRVDQMTVTPATASVPSGPTGLTATPAAASVKLTWTASASGAPTSYRIYRGTKSDGEVNTPVGTTNGTTTTFTDTGLRNGTTYYYFVSAANAVGGSPNSAEVTAVPGGTTPTVTPTPTPTVTVTPPTGAPGVPFGVVISPRAGDILLQWGYQANATWNVYRSTTPGGEGATPYVHVTSPTYVDRAVTAGQRYYYQFSAVNAAGESARTAESSALAQ
ncbi:fibronectin type III domain-containing protein [Sphaerisporangium corydalis]|uniref:Fibronectin type III domain-containing protein n=1 Tax=Sphaerisporangium corydalis TaxID=1441875 RepID=A0ABV9E7R5_9ACTN|nr:fibronectin type III domain-containing protein [Sphaerisporangium corydalis]